MTGFTDDHAPKVVDGANNRYLASAVDDFVPKMSIFFNVYSIATGNTSPRRFKFSLTAPRLTRTVLHIGRDPHIGEFR